MIAICCNTPIQLVCSLILADYIDRDEGLVLFLQRDMINTTRKFELVFTNERVKKVYYFGNKQMNKLLMLISIWKPEKMLSNIGCDLNIEISCIIAPSVAWFSNYIFWHFRKNNDKIKIYGVDEGVAEYALNSLVSKTTKVLHLMGIKCNVDYYEKVYFMAPELLNYTPNIPVAKLPVELMSNSTKSLILGNYNSNREAELLSDYRFIYLQQPFEIFTSIDSRFYEEPIIDILVASIPGDDLVAKLHPSAETFDYKINKVQNQCIAEVLPLCIDISEKVLITGASTSAITPKLLYDEEPIIIFTYYLLEPIARSFFKDEATIKNTKSFLEGIKRLYRNPERVMIPKSLEELRTSIERCKELF